MKLFIISIEIIVCSSILIIESFNVEVSKAILCAVCINGFIVGIHHLFNKEDKK